MGNNSLRFGSEKEESFFRNKDSIQQIVHWKHRKSKLRHMHTHIIKLPFWMESMHFVCLAMWIFRPMG